MLSKNVHRHIKRICRRISSVISLEMIFWHLSLWWLMLQDFFYSANGEETGIDARFTLFGYIGNDWLIEASWNKFCEEKNAWEFEKIKENREIRWHAVLVCQDPCEEHSQRLIIWFLLDRCYHHKTCVRNMRMYADIVHSTWFRMDSSVRQRKTIFKHFPIFMFISSERLTKLFYNEFLVSSYVTVKPTRLFLFLLACIDFFCCWICIAEIRELLPRRGQIKFTEFLCQLKRFTDDTFLFIIITELKHEI